MPQPRTDTSAHTPWLERLLGYGPALAVVALAALAWAGYPFMLEAGRIWSAAILIFLAGVTRGLSFFTEGGARWGQILVMQLRFWLGLAAMVLSGPTAFLLLIAGFASIAMYDPVAAERGTAPRFFAALRPWQMAIILAGLAALLLRSMR